MRDCHLPLYAKKERKKYPIWHFSPHIIIIIIITRECEQFIFKYTYSFGKRYVFLCHTRIYILYVLCKAIFVCLIATFVVVPLVIAILLEQHTAVLSVPTVLAAALPLPIGIHPALSVPGARIRATLHCAVLAVPAGDTKASAVFALTVLVAAGIAVLRVARLARPTGRTVASIVHAVAVNSAVQVAKFCLRERKRQKKKHSEIRRCHVLRFIAVES